MVLSQVETKMFPVPRRAPCIPFGLGPHPTLQPVPNLSQGPALVMLPPWSFPRTGPAEAPERAQPPAGAQCRPLGACAPTGGLFQDSVREENGSSRPPTALWQSGPITSFSE